MFDTLTKTDLNDSGGTSTAAEHSLPFEGRARAGMGQRRVPVPPDTSYPIPSNLPLKCTLTPALSRQGRGGGNSGSRLFPLRLWERAW